MAMCTKKRLYAKAALFTQRVGLWRLSWHCARQAGFFGEPASCDSSATRLPRNEAGAEATVPP